ncbi:uncharacterized protein [Spinacia oleracea]|uniref:MULE transposase domain-containing protein n=1 Tax=Spinacia oleracea TaxID=3562 RepID=A0ABM3QY62_SPIOL|nr:uncharacterized protein LOC110798212 [Spinacia oleracea]
MSCPFRLQAKEHVGGRWSVVVRHGIHNHDLPNYNEGRAIIAKLKPHQLSIVKELSTSHVKPNMIMTILKYLDPRILTTVKHIYNACQKLKTETMGGRSVMQQLMKLIVDNNYVQYHREEVGTDVDAFFRNSWCPSYWKKFAIGFAWLKDEQQGSYEWAIGCIRQLFDPEKLPFAIVTDRELSLMNAINVVFPTSSHLLCTRHIQKNIANYMLKITKNKLIVKSFIKRWQRVVEADTIEMYRKRYREMVKAFARMSAVLNYVRSSWIEKYRNRFVRAYTMNVLHLGNRKTNRCYGVSI